MISVAGLAEADRPGWQALFAAYNQFYGRAPGTSVYDRAWAALGSGGWLHARGAWVEGELVGFVHFLTHPSTTAADVCYLQDLFTAPRARGRGVGTALIGEVAEWARSQDCSRVYWLTHETNATARRLYDKVARYSGFLRYELPLDWGPAG